MSRKARSHPFNGAVLLAGQEGDVGYLKFRLFGNKEVQPDALPLKRTVHDREYRNTDGLESINFASLQH